MPTAGVQTTGVTVTQQQDDDRTQQPERAEDVPAREWPAVLANPKRYRRG